MLGPVSTMMAFVVEFRKRSLGTKRSPLPNSSCSMTGWRPATISRSAESSNFGAAIISQGGDLRQRRQHIDFSQRQRGLADAAGLTGNSRSQFGKQPALDIDDLFLSIENLRFVFLQFGSGEAFGVDQSLLAFVIGRGQMRVRLRDFEIVAKDRIELTFRLAIPVRWRSRCSIWARNCLLLRLRSRSWSSSGSTPV